jgi:hypothetical protein
MLFRKSCPPGIHVKQYLVEPEDDTTGSSGKSGQSDVYMQEDHAGTDRNKMHAAALQLIPGNSPNTVKLTK